MKLLIVDDEPTLLETVEMRMRKEGFSTFVADSAEEGMRLFRRVKPDLIILDIMLPNRSGYDFCRAIRKEAQTPIIFVTARNDEEDRIKGLEMGADDYVTKPFSLRELLSRIRAQLRRAYGELSDVDTSSDLIYVKDLLIDRGRGHVLRDGKNLNLTPIEFRVLVYLAQNHEQALSRGQILDTVWGLDTPYDGDHTINVHIRRLREKVEIDPNHPSLILTVPGVGYRLAR